MKNNNAKHLDILWNGLMAVLGLINESRGVDGLHMNGDIATWEELRTGGVYQEWLINFDEAISKGKEHQVIFDESILKDNVYNRALDDAVVAVEKCRAKTARTFAPDGRNTCGAFILGDEAISAINALRK